jgi:uncharacterized protein (DUF924 family)
MSDHAHPQQVLDFWFGAEGSPEHGKVRAAWFQKNDAFDALIARQFGATVERALAGGLQDWAISAPQALARLILLDQFTRNLFRGSARAFAGDALALQAARELLARGFDAQLRPEQRVFAYLPFEHDETLASQDRSVALFAALAAQAPQLEENLRYAHKHRDVILQFGRFPHRNAALGRSSSADEAAYLAQPGAGF